MATAGAVGWPSWAQLEGPSWAWSSGGQDGIFTPAVLPPALLCYCCPGPGTPDHQLSSPVCLAAPFWGGGRWRTAEGWSSGLSAARAGPVVLGSLVLCTCCMVCGLSFPVSPGGWPRAEPVSCL